jgi:hypothetical protein
VLKPILVSSKHSIENYITYAANAISNEFLIRIRAVKTLIASNQEPLDCLTTGILGQRRSDHYYLYLLDIQVTNQFQLCSGMMDD